MVTELTAEERRRRGKARAVLILLMLLCIAPIAASYTFYYLVKPDKRTNYGDLIEPQRAVPALVASTLNGRAFDLSSLTGRWVMISTDESKCLDACARKLFEMRQIRLETGKDRDRLETVWLITDDKPVSAALVEAYPNVLMLHVDRAALAAWLPAPESQADHIYLVDPHQHLMLRFPSEKAAASDTTLTHQKRIKRDLSKLLSASEIG